MRLVLPSSILTRYRTHPFLAQRDGTTPSSDWTYRSLKVAMREIRVTTEPPHRRKITKVRANSEMNWAGDRPQGLR